MYKSSLILVLILILKTSYSFGKLYSDKDGKRIEFSSYLGEDLWGKKVKPITSHGILYLPQQASSVNRVPLAILISGLGGQRGRDNRMCDVLSANGIACFGVRTYASRGIEHTWKTSKKFEVAGVGSRLHDLYGALEAFRKRDEIDSSNIWQIGFSLGGGVSALAIDKKITKPFQRSNHDFKGFISLYGNVLTTSSKELKQTSYYLFLGNADAAYHDKEVPRFLASIRQRGVKAEFKLFKGSQFNKIGHLWDNMKATTNGWHGKPEGPWKMHQDGKLYSNIGISVYGCGLMINPDNRTILASNSSISNPSDNEAWNFVISKCGKRKSTNVNKHKIIKEVDKMIIEIIKNN